jgi:tRNA1(Val) A37 N6-methylase TrmN6
MSLNDEYSRMVERANSEPADVEVDNLQQGPEWLPRTSEELCNLVGNWRILQRVGSHRWTTDDLVTAWVASLHYDKCLTSINYLDLGTGNASVLQMTVWAMLKQGKKVKAMGVEARSEAVALALRSLQFNLGSPQEIVQIVHSDFRSLAVDKTFDLITGTPPYFSVDFNVKEGKVTKAIINQGGMPTAKQSAPARCEFRGGIEAYCEVASKCLRRVSGRFVFCANWLNHDRVISAAASFGLTVVMQLEVKGRQQKGNLFCVYVMALEPVYHHSTVPVEQLAVRTLNGDWTRDYKERVMSSMSIPFE